MADSILVHIKSALGIPTTVTDFDSAVLMEINTAFVVLNQLGIGPETPFVVTDDTAEWGDLVEEGGALLEAIRSYIWYKVRLSFDPPTVSFLVDAIQKQILELEWRFMVISTPAPVEEVVDEE